MLFCFGFYFCSVVMTSFCSADSPAKVGSRIYQYIKGLGWPRDEDCIPSFQRHLTAKFIGPLNLLRSLFATRGLLRGRTNLFQDNEYNKDWIIFHAFIYTGLFSTGIFISAWICDLEGSKSACTECALELDRLTWKREGSYCRNSWKPVDSIHWPLRSLAVL